MNELFGTYRTMEGWSSWAESQGSEPDMLSSVGGPFPDQSFEDYDNSWDTQHFDFGSTSPMAGFWDANLHSPQYFNSVHRPEGHFGLPPNDTTPHYRGPWSMIPPPGDVTASNASFVSCPIETAELRPSGQHIPQHHPIDRQNTSPGFFDTDSGGSDATLAPREEARVRYDPPLTCTKGSMPRRNNRRSPEDEYTASWTCGVGNDRVGWCGLCRSW